MPARTLGESLLSTLRLQLVFGFWKDLGPLFLNTLRLHHRRQPDEIADSADLLLEYSTSGDLAAAHKVSNPDNAPHLAFVDMGGHGYAVVTAGPQAVESEFVCIPRPIARATTPDGGPLRYRVTHRAERWSVDERPKLQQRVIEGDPKLSI